MEVKDILKSGPNTLILVTKEDLQEFAMYVINEYTKVTHVIESECPQKAEMMKKVKDCIFNARVINVCDSCGIKTMYDLFAISKNGFLRYRNIGNMAVKEIEEWFDERGFVW